MIASLVIACPLMLAVWFSWEKRQAVQPVTLPQTRALVVPHHDLVLPDYDSFYESVPIEQRQQVTQVYVLSPNHFYPEESHVLMRDDDAVLRQLEVKKEEGVFAGEHGVQIHFPFITRYFPKASITPLLFTRNIPTERLQKIIPFLIAEAQKKEVLFIVSTDFSHYLSYAQAEQKDRQTLELIERGDSESIQKLTDDNMDCPACIFTIMQVMQAIGAKHQVIFHANSVEYMKLNPEDPTTSYFVIRWQD